MFGIAAWRQRLLQRKQAQSPEIDVWRLQALFNNFKRILAFNNAILEAMARMERVLGGEYIFDRAFLEASVSAIASQVHHVTYNLNALTANRHIPLYDRYQEIRTLLDDILSGNMRTLAETTALPLVDVGWELEPLVGMDLVCLAELQRHPGIQGAEGVVITSEGSRILAATGRQPAAEEQRVRVSLDEARADLAEQLTLLFAQQSADNGLSPVSVTATRIDDDEEPVREIGRFELTFCPQSSEMSIAPLDSGSGKPLPPLGRTVQADLLPERAETPTPLQAPPVDLVVHCLEQIARRVADQLQPANNGEDAPGDAPFCLFVRSAPTPALHGVVQTRAGRDLPFDALSISARLPDDAAEGDFHLLRRSHPFELLQSIIPPRPEGMRFADNRLATDVSADHNGLARGSALAEASLLQSLAETGVMLERLFGAPLAVHWELLTNNVCRITRLRPLTLENEEPATANPAGEELPPPLCQGGQTVQSGVAAGSVVHVDESTDPADFPPGAVAVARNASPNLTPALQRATALITEYGSAAGHLATVARELRIPAVFGLPDALRLLPPGVQVTVDAGETTVHAGIVDSLLRFGAREMDLSPRDREYRMLRRLLRFILPLNLVNPDSPDFSPQGCRTFHDIIHFCHEMAVDELAHFQERRRGLGAIRTRLMTLGVPMDVRALDIGGGLSPDAGPHPSPAQVLSEPFALFLRGLVDPQAWAAQTPSLGMRDILAGVPRSMNMLAAPADALGANLAIVGRDYINVSLRLGYHFSVIDAHLGEDGYRNYVYFRFVGGLADRTRRRRRARFISDVLTAMDFKVAVNGDLVIGRLKLADSEVLRAALVVLGALTAFSRQQDTGLHSDVDGRELYRQFAAAFLDGFRPPPCPETLTKGAGS